MAIFAEVTENERIIDRRYTSTARLWRFWKSVYDLDLIEIGLSTLYGVSVKTLNSVLCSSRTVSHGYWPTSSSTTLPKLTHTAARFLCDSWATCMCWLSYHKRFLRSTNRTLETGISLMNHYVTWYGICIKISITRAQGRYLHASKYLVAGAWWEAFEIMRGKAMVSIKCKKRLAAGAPPGPCWESLHCAPPYPVAGGVDYLGHFKHLWVNHWLLMA